MTKKHNPIHRLGSYAHPKGGYDAPMKDNWAGATPHQTVNRDPPTITKAAKGAHHGAHHGQHAMGKGGSKPHKR